MIFIVFTTFRNNLPIMVSSPVNNNLWAFRVPINHILNGDANIGVYGDPNMANHRMRPGNWAVGWSIKTPIGATINVERVVQGIVEIGIWYPNGLGARYDLYFPEEFEIDDVAAYALDPEQDILYIILNNELYSVNLRDANANGYGEFLLHEFDL